MALASGTRLGPYEITAQIGVGGMGEVYRATDTTLNRQVAIKVLPESVASDAERIARFEREAKTLASLNHPNIAAIYGFEKSSGVHALVMELVEGPTLADRIAQGAIPVDEALPIAKEGRILTDSPSPVMLRLPFSVMQPWGPDKGRQATLVSEHATVEAFDAIDQLSAEMVRTGAPSNAVELIVVNADDRVVPRPGAH